MNTNRNKPLRDLKDRLVSVWLWVAMAVLTVLWFPLLLVVRLFDRDEVHYRTGRWFRRLGVAMTRINPFCRIEIDGEYVDNPRLPFVVVCNHQSWADIPVISRLPWEMKWIGKDELFRVPVTGWMMRLAGDIPLDRDRPSSGFRALVRARWYLDRHCSVMIFPEGTRSRDGRLQAFKSGAFTLAIKAGVPVLPLAIDGTRACLPKHGWVFGGRHLIRLTVLPPVHTTSMDKCDAGKLSDLVRSRIQRCLEGNREKKGETSDTSTDPFMTIP